MPAAQGAERDADLAPALETIRRLSVPPPMPGGKLALRINTSQWLRARVPKRLMVGKAERRARDIWARSTEAREHAAGAMEAIIAGTPRAPELEQLARQHLIERHAGRAIFWAPWSTRVDGDSSARIERLLAQSGGVLLSVCHLGPFYCLEEAPPFQSRPTYLVPGNWFFEQPTADEWGRRLARWRRGTKSLVVPADGSFPVLQELLERRNPVFIYFDMPGPRETSFLGKSTMLAEGTVQLAARTHVPILPLRARRVGAEVLMDVGEPLDPRDFQGVDELQAALAARHERWILENPAPMEDLREIGWGGSATAQSWTRP